MNGWDLPINIDFTMGFLGYIMNLIKVNGVPLYLIVIALIGIYYFAGWMGYLIEVFMERMGGGF